MSGNIHGFNDPNRNNDNNNNNNNNNINNNGYSPVLFGQMDNNLDPGEIRKESFGHFLKSICCPTFTIKSFIFIISMIDIILYIITLCYKGIKKDATELLAPQFNSLDTFGMKYPYKIYNGQVYRLITFGLLHANLIHITINLFSQFIIGCMMETEIGTLSISLLYLFSNIGGGLFSCCINDTPGVGASVAIFGMLGAYIGYMIINWNYLDRVLGTMNKFCNLIFIIFIVLMNISYGFSNEMIDNYGHLGGLIWGFFLIFLLIKPKQENDGLGCGNNVWKIVAICTIVGLTVCEIAIFWFLVKPKNKTNL